MRVIFYYEFSVFFHLRQIPDLFYDNNGRKGIMRHITVSFFAFLLVLPAFADARLPVVNLASAGVSARAAFGESAPTTQKQQLPKRNVVARPSVARASAPAKVSVDMGENIAVTDNADRLAAAHLGYIDACILQNVVFNEDFVSMGCVDFDDIHPSTSSLRLRPSSRS